MNEFMTFVTNHEIGGVKNIRYTHMYISKKQPAYTQYIFLVSFDHL